MKKLTFLICLGVLLFSTSSCTFRRLSVQTQSLSHESLASYHVGTPDPRLYKPMIGQRLLIQWSLCAAEVQRQDAALYLKVRLRDRQEREISVPITSRWGTYIYELANEDYSQSGGILTYYAEIRNSSCILATWKHPLWANLIQLNFSNSQENKPDETR